MQNDLLKRIEKKKNERDSFESSVSNCDLSRIDEKEKNMVSVALLNISIYKFKIDIICS